MTFHIQIRNARSGSRRKRRKVKKSLVLNSVSDPDSSIPDPDPPIQHLRLNTNPVPDPDPGFFKKNSNSKKFTAGKKFDVFLYQKLQFIHP